MDLHHLTHFVGDRTHFGDRVTMPIALEDYVEHDADEWQPDVAAV